MSKNVIMFSIEDMVNVVKFRTAFGLELQTPAIDRLMSMGVTMENAFTPVPLCCPSRAATVTGRNPFATGIHHNQGAQLQDVATVQDTLFGAMDLAGYQIALCGKTFHSQNEAFVSGFLGDTVDAYGGTLGYSGSGNTLPSDYGSSPVPEAETRDAMTAAWAAEFIDGYDSTDPFFLAVGFSKPHLSWDVPAAYYDLYDLADVVVPEIGGVGYDDLPQFFQDFLGHSAADHDAVLKAGMWKEMIHAYAAAISFADAQLARVLDAIDENQLWDESTVVLWSDHGLHFGDREVWKKFTLWEAAAGVTFIIADPDIGRAGEIIASPASLLDLWPTLAGLTEIPGPENGDGVDLFSDHGRVGVITSAYGSISIRTEEWRYTLYQSGEEELFEIAEGVHGKDVADDRGNARILEEMRDLLKSEARDQYGVLIADEFTKGGDADEIFTVIGHHIAKGRAGDDLYFVVEGGRVVELEDEGTDKVFVATNQPLVLYDNVENAELIQKATGKLVGNALNNVLTGNSKANRILGGMGADTILGAAGDDRLFGGSWGDMLDGGVGNDTLNGDAGKDELHGGTMKDHLYGGEHGDWLYGEQGKDRIFGEDGFDRLFGGEQDDFLDGGRGTDALDGGGGDDTLEGGGGDDTLEGGDGKDTLRGDDGRDVLRGGTSQDGLFGGEGADRLHGDSGRDRLYGDLGDDRLYGGGQNDILDGGAGNDRLLGGNGDDVLHGGADNDSLFGEDGNDRLYGDAGDDTLDGGAGDDTLNGGEDKDELHGGTMNDHLYGGEHGDWLYGEDGNDRIYGEDGFDRLFGGEQDDLLDGGKGTDKLFGGRGDDTLKGGGGDDRLDGGEGDDRLIGGDGADVFIFRAGYGDDRIVGFGDNTDTLVLDDALWGEDLTIGQVLEEYASDIGDDVVLDFGEQVLTIQDVADVADLTNDIDII